jgi:PAS domain S-box-containing protein
LSAAGHNPAFAALPIAAFVADASGIVVDVSASWEAVLGLSADACVGKPLWDCLGGDLGQRLHEAWQRFDTIPHQALQGTVPDPGAQERCWEVDTKRLPSGEVVGQVRDVTEGWQRAQLQRRLLAWSKRLQQAASFGELVDLAEAEGMELTPYRSFWLFIRPETDSPVARRLASSGRASAAQWEHLPEIVIAEDAVAREVCEGDHTVIIEDARTDPRTNKDMVAALGNRTLINVPMFLLDQNLGAFGMGSFSDEGVRLPTPLELEAIETMAAHIAVAAGRLRFLAERERAARERQRLEIRMLRMQNLESLAVLAGGVAHDVNNLMTAVIGNVSLGRRALQPGSDADVSLQHAHTAATRTAALAAQMLAYAGKGAQKYETGDLHALAEETLALARVGVPKKALLELRGEAGCTVRGDLTQLRQLLMNLVTNAGEAIGEGNSGTVTITLQRKTLRPEDFENSLLERAEPGEYVIIEVTDDGCGMDDDTRGRLFDPFFTTKVTGRGLGMSAALGIVRGHGGALWVRSSLGAGSTFRIALPASNAQLPAPPPEAAVPSRERVVLVAEDDPIVRKLTRITLQRAGFEVIEARDGREALELFQANAGRIGVALVDSLMPGFSGSEVMRGIRSSHPDFPVVVCSGDVHDASAHGQPTAVLAKPWQPDDLVRVLETSLDEGRVSRAPQRD